MGLKFIAWIQPVNCPIAFVGTGRQIVWREDAAKRFDTYEEAEEAAKQHAFANEEYGIREVAE